ncbi:MAG: hypothetical protein RLP15_11860 [Cryomorphaceae bacterium]
MKRWITMLSAVALIFSTSCEKEPERRVIEQWTETQPKLVGFYLEEGGQQVKVKEEKFYADGTREYYGSFDTDGARHGEWRYYYESGQLWSLGFYNHGSKEGKKEVYWPDGTKRYEGQFKDDLKMGVWTFYNPDGTELQKMNFDLEKAE